MSKNTKPGNSHFTQEQDCGDFQLYRHNKNGLRLLHYPILNTGIVTTNITYKVGSVDERRGESGLAHMLEHMLFKPTKQDVKQNIVGGMAMKFERDTGAILNANTSYDRTTYFYSFPTKHLPTVLQIEANRMTDVLLNDTEFLPERGNVLSEFDMYNGDPYFVLETAMRTAMIQSHAYDHEIIGFREDIEDYTIEKLQSFYDRYYQPNNATLMLIGDINRLQAEKLAHKYFGDKKNVVTDMERQSAREPALTGSKTVTIIKPGSTDLLGISFMHAAFPTHDWYVASLAMSVLAGNSDSILHKKLVDTGLVSSLDHQVFSSAQPNMGTLYAKLAPGVTHAKVLQLIYKEIENLDRVVIAKRLKQIKTTSRTTLAFKRTSTLAIAAELTELAASDTLEHYQTKQASINRVTPAEIAAMLVTLFDQKTITVGYYKSV